MTAHADLQVEPLGPGQLNVAIIGALFLVLGAGTGALSLEREQA